jgi:hypothetical protein
MHWLKGVSNMSRYVRIIRTLEYFGPEVWADQVFSNNYVSQQGNVVGSGRYIREISKTVAEVLEIKEDDLMKDGE